MATHDAVQAWDDDGFVVLKSLLSAAELAPALAELPLLYPTAEEFHSDVDAGRRNQARTTVPASTRGQSEGSV